MSSNLFSNELTFGPNCQDCPLSRTHQCMGYTAAQNVIAARDSYAALEEMTDQEAAVNVQTRMLGAATALGALTDQASASLTKLQTDLNECKGAVAVPGAPERGALESDAFKLGSSSPLGVKTPAVAAHINAYIIKQTAQQTLLAASPALGQLGILNQNLRC